MAKRYVEFVRNIFDTAQASVSLEPSKKLAEAAGYRYLSFNGHIWYKTDKAGWIELEDLNLSDFEC